MTDSEGKPSDDERLSSAEAMMHRIEHDPWLDPSGGSISIFDQPLDYARLRAAMTAAIADIPRLRQRLVEGTGPVPPHWTPDPDFDLDHHLRRIGAPGSGTLAELVTWANHQLLDPYDHHRPLWQYVVIDGVEGNRGALFAKLHHTIADGETAMAMAAAYTHQTRDHPDPPAVDLDEVIRRDQAEHPGTERLGGLFTDALRLPLDLARRAADLITHPQHLAKLGTETFDLARTVADQALPAGSRLWHERSGRRRCEILSLPFAEVRSASHALGGTVNDLFLTGIVEAARHYHLAHEEDLSRLHVTFVVNTRAGGDAGPNAFTPVPVDLPAGSMAPAERFAIIHDRVAQRRSEVHGSGPMGTVSAVSALLPTGVMTAVVRDQARHIDVATSNLPGMMGPWYTAGALIEHSWAFGPVAGTPVNITAVSTYEHLDIGLHIDPAAITDPAGFRELLVAAYDDLLSHA